MAAMNSKYSLLFLLAIGIQCLGEKCPKQCNCGLKNAKYTVDCRGKGISEVFSSDELPSRMQVLYLSRNNISVIRQGFLNLHPQLEKIYFTRNSIKTLEKRAFVGLSFLKRLVLKQNRLVDIKPKAFVGLPNLDILDISLNKIKNIDKFAFDGLKSLTKLILRNNLFKSIENGTFDSLTTLKKIDLEKVPLACDCRLNPFIQFLTERSIKRVLGNCLGKPTKFSELKGKNLCEKPAELSIFPSNNQVVASGDSLRLNCTTGHKTSLNFKWKKDQRPILNGTRISLSRKVEKEEQNVSVYFRSITKSDGGVYTCYSDTREVKPKNVLVDVVSLKMCARGRTNTNRSSLLWPATLANRTAFILCPLLGNDDRGSLTMNRTCSPDALWGVVNAKGCRWIPLSQKLNELRNLLAQEHFRDISGLLARLKVISEPGNFNDHQDVTLVFNLVNGVDRKQGSEPFNGEVLDNILTIFNNMMDVDKGILYEAERTDQSPSRLAELITRRIANQKLSRVLSNIVIGSVRLQESGFKGKTCNVFFNAKNPALSQGVLCEPQRNKKFLVSIHIPKTIFENLRSVGNKDDYFGVQFLIYRNSKLFPNVVSNTTAKSMKEKNISSNVLTIQMANIKELNLTEPLVITFTTKAGTYPFITHFDFAERGAGKTWSPNSDCRVNRSTSTTTTVDCVRLVNRNLAVMSLLGSESEVAEHSVEIVVYFGAITACLCLFATLVTYAAYRTLLFNRDDAAMLMNVCLSLMVVLITFAFGIDRTINYETCLLAGIFLHFFFLASLLWLGSYVVCVSRSLKPPKETEEVFNPVLRYYMISWGVPAVVCGITLAGDLKNYKTSDYCWLTESAGLGAFVGPACLLFIINSVLLVRLHLQLARGSSDRRGSLMENSEEERLQTDQPGELEPCSDPGARVLAEKSIITLNLVATWVVMSLVYANFIFAYLLVKSRHVTVAWKLLSYVYALVNIALGLAIFGFHCLARENVREAWRKTWKTVSAKRINININYGRWRTWWITWISVGNRGQGHASGRILLNGENIIVASPKSESDRQSNITLPSSAALTNDVFLNGRPLSTARVSLLDEADFPPEEHTQDGAEVNEVDITAVGSDVDHPQSQASGYSGRGSAVIVDRPVVPKATAEITAEQETAAPVAANLFSHETQEETQTDITDGVTSRSESSAPTAIDVSLPRTSTTSDISIREKRPKTFAKPQRPVETAASPSSSSLSEAPGRGGQNFKGRKSSDSLNSRNGSGSVGPRARKLHLLQPKYPLSGSSTYSEIPPVELEQKAKHSSESVNTRGTPRNAGASNGIQRSRNRYKDGREKPEPKQWTGNGGARIAYVSVPHVSKIHREPSRNETSV